MKFVTKAEFEKAVEILKLAVKNGQVQYGHHDNPESMTNVYFSNGNHMVSIDISHAAFVSPIVIAQSKLLNVRNQLNKHRNEHEIKSKELEDLEKSEKELAKSLATLKE